MASNRRIGMPGSRTFGIGSVIGVLLGLTLIAVGGRLPTTVGVITIIIGAISLLLAVGRYLDDQGPGTPE